MTINEIRHGKYFSRWMTLSAGLFFLSISGLSYSYGLYSDDFKTRLNYSQTSLDLVASFGELGLWSSILVGLMLEIFSPRFMIIIGGIISMLGLSYIAAALNKTIASSVVTVVAAYYIANLGITFGCMTSAALCVRNFPAIDRGKICGFVKSMAGLSSAVLAALFTGFFSDDKPISFLILLVFIVPLFGIISSIPMNVVPASHLSYQVELLQGFQPNFEAFYIWYGLLMAVIVLGISIQAGGIELPRPYWGAGTIVLLASVYIVPQFYGKRVIKVDSISESEPFIREVEPLLGTASDQDGDYEMESRVPSVDPALAIDGDVGMTLKEGIQDIRFWSLLFVFMCGAGAGLVVINNISSIADSLEISASSLLVSVIGLCNALGRLIAGWVSDKIVEAGYPRAIVLCINLIMSSLVSLLLSLGIPTLLYLGSALAGFAYGSMFSVALAVTGDLFGTKHIATIYGLLDLGPAAGSFLFATFLVNIVYGDEENCVGRKCFAGTFLISSMATLFASFCAYVFLVRPSLKLLREEKRRLGAGPKKLSKLSLA
mmetsp:Transcript_9409/g.14191  ORF Transcript_9409/g.14191 Transcript_9409/m.14191 type:complete len:545 (+) Transcript_9409:168-1802(+)